MNINLVRIIAVFSFFIFSCVGQAQVREELILRDGWKFSRGAHEKAWQRIYDDSCWQPVTVPHDWAIGGPWIADGDGNTGKLQWKGEGWYRKRLEIPAGWEGKRIYLLCDGIMAFPEIFVNGDFAGRWDYGYNSFWLDLSGYLVPGRENILAIHTDTRNHDSRWYPGAGIFRKIRLIAVNPVHIPVWGVGITVPEISPSSARVQVVTGIRNDSGGKAKVRIRHTVLSPENLETARGETTTVVCPGCTVQAGTQISVKNPSLWDVESPNLYALVTRVFIEQYPSGNTLLTDSMTTYFGIRECHFTADSGFRLNGRRVQLRGVNLHHDLGPLGAAFNERAMERQLEIMKAMGCNAIRTSHNPPAPELPDLCDRMGLLVIDEAFDKYDMKAGIADTTDFDDFARRNLRNFILRDRNHPSVFLWSVGNEIGDVQWNINNGFQKLRTITGYVRAFDPSRPVTLVCDSKESAALRHFDFYDVHCWNYGRRYALARELEPGKAVVISESASTLSTRGYYEFPLPAQKTDFTGSRQVSSYDLNAPWWAELADDDFMWQQQEPYVAGEFVWTGFDYLGEPTPYTNQWCRDNGLPDSLASRSSYFGVADLCGIPKDRYWLYKSYWKPEENTIHILPHWNWPDRIGDTVPVFVYTNGDCAELSVNGTSYGKKCKDPMSEISTERFRLMWKDVLYEPGTVKAVAYKNGLETGTAVMKTAGAPAKLKLTPDRDCLRATGDDLSFILVEALDSSGVPCPLADNLVSVMLTGPGSIAAVCNGNPQSYESFQADSIRLFYGKAMIVMKVGTYAGEITLEVTAEGLTGEKVSFRVI